MTLRNHEEIMHCISFTNEYDETILVSRLTNGRIVVAHSDYPEPGEFIEPGFPFQGQPRWGGLRINGQNYFLTEQETEQVRKAIQKLNPEPDEEQFVQ